MKFSKTKRGVVHDKLRLMFGPEAARIFVSRGVLLVEYKRTGVVDIDTMKEVPGRMVEIIDVNHGTSNAEFIGETMTMRNAKKIAKRFVQLRTHENA